MLHETHSAILWPAFLIVVSDDVFIVGIGVFCEISLDEFSALVFFEAEDHVESVDVSAVHANRVADFRANILEGHEIVWRIGQTCDFGCSL